MGLVLQMFNSGGIDVLCKTKIERILSTNNIKKVQKFCSRPELLQPPYYRTEKRPENYSPGLVNSGDCNTLLLAEPSSRGK